MSTRKIAVTEISHYGTLIGGTMYWSPSLFHMAPTHDRIVPLAISDVIHAKNLMQIYGIQGLDQHKQGYVMMNNYPVKVIKIMGRVMSYSFKLFDEGGVKSRNNFLLINLDDCSGDKLLICAKVMERDAHFPIRDMREDILIEAIGNVHHLDNYMRQFQCLSARIVGRSSDLAVEIKWWSSTLETRKLLQSPWKYMEIEKKKEKQRNEEDRNSNLHEISAQNQCVLTRAEHSRRLQKKKLQLNTGGAQILQEYPIGDSFTIPRNSPEIIDLTLEPEQEVETEAESEAESELESEAENESEVVANMPILASFLLAREESEEFHTAAEN